MTRASLIAQTIAICTALGLCACNGTPGPGAASAKGEMFSAVLSGREEVPPANSRVATGTALLGYDKASRLLTWNVAFSDLTSDATAAQIHGPAGPGANAGVVLTLTPRNMFPIVSPLQGAATLTEAQAADLMAGKWYVNIRSRNNPNGEIRGQLLPR
jgi:hypothetical protein